MKQKHRRKIAALLTIILLLSSFRMITFADTPLIDPSIHEEIAAETPDSLGTGETTIMPMDIDYSTVTIGTVTTTSVIYYAPHPNVSASTGYTLSAGTNFYCMGREYEYLYIYWYINGKEMFGYIPYANTNMTSNHYWITYDIFRPATCSATTPVLSYAGTTNTYMSTGEIYAGESPLMVLGKRVNPYNNRTYYYVQYQTSAGLVKRGWIDADNGTVTYVNRHSSSTVDQENCYFSFVNRYTGKALTWNNNDENDDGILKQLEFTGALNQTFILEKVYYNNIFSGHYRILSAENPNMALSVDDTGYGEGLPIKMATKGIPDKRQEFLFTTVRGESANEVYFFILSRSSGEYRALEVINGSSEDKAHVIQSVFDQYRHQCWIPKLVNDPWGGVYIQDSNGGNFPGTYNVIVEPSASNNYFTTDIVQLCLNRWNNNYAAQYSARFNLTATTSTTGKYLSKVAVTTEPDDETLGVCMQVLSAGATPTTGAYDNNFYATQIYLYPGNYNGFNNGQKQKILTHEIGHALKLSHTYAVLKHENGTLYWETASQELTTMDQNEDSPYNPTELDIFRLYMKWKNVA